MPKLMAEAMRAAIEMVDGGSRADTAAEAAGVDLKALKRAIYNRTYAARQKAEAAFGARASGRAVVKAAGLALWKVNVDEALGLLERGLSHAAAVRKMKG